MSRDERDEWPTRLADYPPRLLAMALLESCGDYGRALVALAVAHNRTKPIAPPAAEEVRADE